MARKSTLPLKSAWITHREGDNLRSKVTLQESTLEILHSTEKRPQVHAICLSGAQTPGRILQLDAKGFVAFSSFRVEGRLLAKPAPSKQDRLQFGAVITRIQKRSPHSNKALTAAIVEFLRENQRRKNPNLPEK